MSQRAKSNIKVTFVVGPTACGKSGWALERACELKAKGQLTAIVNCDSIQVYQGLQIGSATPSEVETKLVEHRLYSYVKKGGKITAGEYARDFMQTMQELERQNFQQVFVVGGTGFYFQAIEKGMYSIGASDPVIKAQVELELTQANGAQNLYEELKSKDPQAAEKISLNDHYRLGRAIEMMRVHGKTVTAVKAEMESSQTPFPWPLEKVGFLPSKEVLAERISLRTQKMLELGLVDEVSTLLGEGLESWEALQSVGYRETIMFLNGQVENLDALKALINQNTLKLTKRQKTWFKRDSEIRWLS